VKADVKPPSKTDQLLAIIEGLGVDKFMNPVSIRVPELAQRSGIDPNSIPPLLTTAVAKGRVIMCKITVPGKAKPLNEYRKAAGAGPHEWMPLNTKRAGVALRTPARPSAPAVPLSTPKPGVNDIEPATLGKPQRAVGTTPAAGDQGPPPVAPAVTAAKATPKSTTSARLKKEPAAWPASAGDAFSCGIDEDGTLLITAPEGFLELEPAFTKRLGHFLVNSQGIWNPF
jgi:hypothetical protein